MSNLEHLIENTLVRIENNLPYEKILELIKMDSNFEGCPLSEQEVWEICQYVYYTWDRSLLNTINGLEQEKLKFKEERDKMLRDTVAELAEAKRLLKAAVEDLRFLESHTVDEEGSCLISDRGEKILCSDCPFNNGGKVNEKCVWNYEAEALALIGKDGDTECQ